MSTTSPFAPPAPVQPASVNYHSAPAEPVLLPIRAFNLPVGAVFLTPHCLTRFAGVAAGAALPVGLRLVAVFVSRDADTELIRVVARLLDGSRFPLPEAMLEVDVWLDYGQAVDLVGLVVNPDDPDDSDLGTD